MMSRRADKSPILLILHFLEFSTKLDVHAALYDARGHGSHGIFSFIVAWSLQLELSKTGSLGVYGVCRTSNRAYGESVWFARRYFAFFLRFRSILGPFLSSTCIEPRRMSHYILPSKTPSPALFSLSWSTDLESPNALSCRGRYVGWGLYVGESIVWESCDGGRGH